MPVFDGKIRDRIQSRNFFSKRDGRRFGQGSTISKVKTRADKFTSRVKGRSPGIISKVEETLGKWNVGSRITEMMPANLKQRVKKKQDGEIKKLSGADISL